MENIKIIRLKTGEDIISVCQMEEYSVTINNPLTFFVKATERGLMYAMVPWIPIGVTDNNTVELHNEDILIVIDPNEKVKQLYHKMVKQLEMIGINYTEDTEDDTNVDDDQEDDISESVQQEQQGIKKYLH